MSNDYKMELIRNLVDNLPVLRAKNGITQETLGEVVGLSRQSIAMIENGTRKLSWTNYLAIVYALSFDENVKTLMEQLDVIPTNFKNEIVDVMSQKNGRKNYEH